MSPSEYSELVDFLGGKFDRIDQRFEQIDQRFEQIDQRFEALEEQVSGIGVLVDRNRTQIQLLAESLRTTDGRIDALRTEMHEEFASVRAEMKAGFDAIHARVDGLEAA